MSSGSMFLVNCLLGISSKTKTVTPSPNLHLSVKGIENSSIINRELGTLESILASVITKILVFFLIIMFIWSNLSSKELIFKFPIIRLLGHLNSS